MLRCFVKESKRRPQECAARMKSISRDWLTDQSEDSAEVSPEQCNVSTNYVYMKDGKDLIVQLSGKTGGQYFSNNQLLWNRGSPNELPCIKGEGGPAKELGSHLLMSWSGDDIVTRRVLMEDVFGKSIADVDFLAMSRELIEERADGIRRALMSDVFISRDRCLADFPALQPHSLLRRLSLIAEVPFSCKPLTKLFSQFRWLKVAGIVTLSTAGGEIALFLATFAAVELIAKPRIQRYKEKLGIAYKIEKRAIKKRALKRLRKLRTRRLRVRRRRLLREQRRGEKQRRSQIGSDESSSSSSSSLGTKSVVDLTTARPSVGTAYDVARRHSSPKNAKSREGPQAEPIRNDAIDIADNQQTRAPAKGRKYGVDRTNTQIPEPSEDRTGTTHDANRNITHNDQLEKK
ncbi:unnamed protein product [Toxocara canis]|uniref:Ion_trans_2 domain-containing protein n=1 Tax=Toxocara canis TaxID=6265 RepID=A0A183UMC8_TOXCA|nr:unnamed protein product [Toxocara canis]